MTDSVDSNGAALPTPGLFKLCSSVASTETDAGCDKFLELYSYPAWPAAGTWRIRGWDATVEYLAGTATPAFSGPPSRGWLANNGSRNPAPVLVVCNRTDDDSFRPPKLVPIGAAEVRMPSLGSSARAWEPPTPNRELIL